MDDTESSFSQVDSNDAGFLLEQQEHFIETPTPDFETTYRYVKNLIFDGFIPFKASFLGVSCIFKALTPSEFRFLELLESDSIKRIPLYFLYSLAYLDGVCVLPHRENLHEEIIKLWEKLPIPIANYIVDIIQAIQSAQYSCYDRLEAYLYESESRFTWLTQGMDAVKNRNIKGSEHLGMNPAQESWIAFNKREDLREEQERLFEHSKFIVSGMIGGKEIKKIENSERMRQQTEQKRRQEVRLKNKTVEKPRFTASVNTVEDLVAELNRQIRGEKDAHDRIIEQHEKKLKEMHEKRMRELEASIALAKIEEMETDGSKPVTPDEMQKVMRERAAPIETFDNMNHYIEKIQQTERRTEIELPSDKVNKIGDMKPKSIFDEDVQKELSRLKSNS